MTDEYLPISLLLINLEDSINTEQLSSINIADPLLLEVDMLFPMNVQSVIVALFFLTSIQPALTTLLIKVRFSTSNFVVEDLYITKPLDNE